MKICIVGTGYVGLVTGVCFADMGNDVTCIDIDNGKIDQLNSGKIPIYEPGLEDLVHRNMSEGRISFSTDLAAGVSAAKIVFIAVGTPENEDGSADLQHVINVAGQIGEAMEDYRLIVIKSTVPVGTCEKVGKKLKSVLKFRHAELAFDVASNPEFLKEGNAIQDFMKPDRIVIGCDSEEAEKLLRELYSPFLRTNHPVIAMDVRSAEMTKYAANAMLATKISFINEIANLCEALGADVKAVRLGITSDTRIGAQFLFPGLGYGGSCFPKDVKALIHTARSAGYEPTVMEAVDNVNNRQKSTLAAKTLKHFEAEGLLASGDPQVAVWGLAFKPNTDDVREAPSLTVIQMLLDAGVSVRAYDPVASKNAVKALGSPENLTICDTEYATLEGAHALLVCTEWGQFRLPDFERMNALMASPVIFDGRNIYDPEKMALMGFKYYGIGRKAL